MKDRNNVRNRWRRYRLTRSAHHFSALPFRMWVCGAGRTDSYSAEAGKRDEPVRLIACHCRRGAMVCACLRHHA